MTAQVYLRPVGERQSIGVQSSGSLEYLVIGAATTLEARAACEGQVPLTWDGMILSTLDPERVADGVHYVIANYVNAERQDQEKKEVGDSQFSFDIAAQTQRITQSLGTRRYGTRPPNFNGAIGVTKDTVEGVDVYFPTYSFSEQHILAATAVTPQYKAKLFAACATTNSATFRGFQAGEVLFLGAAGTKRGKDDWSVTFKFVASPNVEDLTVGEITDIVKEGWEYLWVRYKDEVDTDTDFLVKAPRAVYVEKVYRDHNFANLGIGTA